MSTSLVLGAAGAAVGAYFGGAIGAQVGFMIGSFIGGLIDPVKTQGPKIGDTRLQRATYGAAIPYAWGHGRLGCTVIDQTDLIEHSHGGGGKGGDAGPETFSYSASWMSSLCYRLPERDRAIDGISHLFMDGRLVWTQDSGDECPCAVYLGTEDQLPDPTFEAIHGVGNQPAYRGLALVVFTDYDLSDYGNRIPNVEVVVYTKGGTIPYRVAEFDPWATPQHSNYLLAGATVANGVITTVEMDNVIGLGTFRIRKWNMDGTQVGDMIEWAGYGGTNPAGTVMNLGIFVRSYHVLPSGEDYQWLKWNPATEEMVEVHVDHNPASSIPMLYANGYIFGGINSGGWHLTRRHAEGGIPGLPIDSLLIGDVAFTLGQSNEEGVIYVLYEKLGEGVTLLKISTETLTVLQSWGPDATSAVPFFGPTGAIFGVHNGVITGSYNDPDLGKAIRLVKIVGDELVEYGGEIATQPIIPTQSISLGNGLYLDPNGIYSINPAAEGVSLEQIVGDITSLTPAQDYDFSEFASDVVPWFVIGNQTTARNAVQVLRPLWPFDIVEEDYAIVGRRRGEREIVVIPDDDLAARPWGDESPDPLRTIRKREQELPRLVSMVYIDIGMDWNTNVASSPRQVTLSEYDVSTEAPVGLTSEQAAQMCETIQTAEWTEREGFQWSMRMKWDKVTPATLVNVRGRLIRVQKVLQTTIGVLNCEGVLAAPSLYTQSAPGQGSSGVVNQTPTGRPVPTESVLLDIPVLSLDDAPYGFYWAAGPATPGPWAGATLYKSLDGGINYFPIATIARPSTIGHTRDYEDSPATSGVLDPYFGGDVVDESTLCVVLTNPDLSLVSTNDEGLDAGANLVAISRGDAMSPGSPQSGTWELAQFRDAELLATDEDGRKIYALTGWLRGRKDTSTEDHDVGDTFVLLATAVNVDAPQSELNRELLYKAVTVRRTLAETPAVPFTNTGAGADEWHKEVGKGLPQTQAAYVLTVPNATLLPNSRTLTAGTGVTITDNGPGSTVVVASTGGGGGGSITIKDEGSTLTTAATSINFLGASITASHVGAAVDVEVVQSIHTLSHGVDVDPAAFTLNFNAPLYAADAGSGVTNVLLDTSGIGGAAASWAHVFGNGEDGNAIFDGVNAVTGATRSGTVYTLTRSVAYADCRIDAGVIVKFGNQGGIWVNGTLTWDGAISAAGNDATTALAGAGLSAGFWGVQAGGGAAGGAGGSVTTALGGNGGSGGANTGGTAGLPAGGGGAGGTATAPAAADGGLAYAAMLQAALSGRSSGALRYVGGAGGSGATGGQGHGGGAGACGLVVARIITGSGIGTYLGGGGLGASPTSGGNQGGGGGGGGGVLWLVTSTSGWAAFVTMGALGGGGGLGVGTGRNGVTGSPGRTYVHVLA